MYINFRSLVLWLRWYWMVPPSSMFSSTLPNASSTAKFVQNGHPKVLSTFNSHFFLSWNISPRTLSVLCTSLQNPSALNFCLSYSYESGSWIPFCPTVWAATIRSEVCFLSIAIVEIWNPVITTSHMTLGYGSTTSTLFIRSFKWHLYLWAVSLLRVRRFISSYFFPCYVNRQHPNSKESCNAGKLFGGTNQETSYSSCTFKLCCSWIRGTSSFSYESNYCVYPPRLRTLS